MPTMLFGYGSIIWVRQIKLVTHNKIFIFIVGAIETAQNKIVISSPYDIRGMLGKKIVIRFLIYFSHINILG